MNVSVLLETGGASVFAVKTWHSPLQQLFGLLHSGRNVKNVLSIYSYGAGEFKTRYAETSWAYLVYGYTLILPYISFFFLLWRNVLLCIIFYTNVQCDKQPKAIFRGQSDPNIYQKRLFHHVQDSRNGHIILSCLSLLGFKQCWLHLGSH